MAISHTAICGVYKITSPSNKIYIGSSVNIIRRWQDYKSMDCKKQRKLFNSFKKYGVENHVFEILEETSFDLLYERETYYGILYGCLNGLNCKLPKTCENKNIMSNDTKELIRQIRIGKIHTRETKDKISRSKMGSIPHNKGTRKIKIKLTKEEISERRRLKMLGRSVSDETRLKQSLAKKGKPSNSATKFKKGMIAYNKGMAMSDDVKEKLRLANIGRKFTDEHKQKLAEASRNRVWSEESKTKISKSKIGHVVSDETKNKISESMMGKEGKNKIKIFTINPINNSIMVFDSITNASQILNIKRTNISNNINGYSKCVNSVQYGKIKFEYYDSVCY